MRRFAGDKGSVPQSVSAWRRGCMNHWLRYADLEVITVTCRPLLRATSVQGVRVADEYYETMSYELYERGEKYDS